MEPVPFRARVPHLLWLLGVLAAFLLLKWWLAPWVAGNRGWTVAAALLLLAVTLVALGRRSKAPAAMRQTLGLLLAILMVLGILMTPAGYEWGRLFDQVPVEGQGPIASQGFGCWDGCQAHMESTTPGNLTAFLRGLGPALQKAGWTLRYGIEAPGDYGCPTGRCTDAQGCGGFGTCEVEAERNGVSLHLEAKALPSMVRVRATLLV